MNGHPEKWITALSDAGCSKEDIEKAQRILETGNKEELIRHFRMCRCGLMDDLHEIQRRVDRMDYLICQTRRELL